MSLKIDASTLLVRLSLTVDSGGVLFYNGAFGSAKRFRFRQIECLLLSADDKLSFQVGAEVFTIQTKPGNPKHQRVIDILAGELLRNADGG
jgi:hypothetical protein